jgi:SP family myo-inositol transporter-like MFS transporter 13
MSGGWRYMAGLCAIPAGIQMVALWYLPNSPRQLIVHGKLSQAKTALSKIYPLESDSRIENKISVIQAEAHNHALFLGSQTLRQRLRDMVVIGHNRRALIVACGLQLLQQLSGFNTLMWVSHINI